jgi:hypothetical protein
MEIGSPKVSIGKIRTFQIGPAKVGVFQVDHAKVGFTKVRAAQIWLDSRTCDSPLVPYLSALPQQSDLLLVCHCTS